MEVKKTTDKSEIKQILCYPEIYRCISDDKSPPMEEFDPPINDNVQYIAGYVNNEIIAIMVYHCINDRLKIHVQVLPEFRKKYAHEFARIALDIGKAKNVNIYAEIPDCYPNVVRFAESFDFVKSGVIKEHYLRDGVFYDVNILELN